MKLVLTCEHAGNKIPSGFGKLFWQGKAALNSHRGYDPGAFDLFISLRELADYDQYQQVSRLLVEMNRSLDHPELFSEFTEHFAPDIKKDILKAYYFPFRNHVESQVAAYLEAGEEVLHFSIHTFTSVLDGAVRDADMGILFDPRRRVEKQTAVRLKEELQRRQQNFKIKLNYPYLGTADGFTTFLRNKFPINYTGIELEVNQKYVVQNKMDPNIKKIIFKAVSELGL